MKRTPLYQEHKKLTANMVDFGGWEMPLHYPKGILEEHLATRKFGGLFDISHMGRLLLKGEDALPFLQYVLTNNAAALEPGNAQYTIIPNESGGAIDDAYLYRLDKQQYLLVINAANAEKDWQWLQEQKLRFPRAVLEDVTGAVAMLALQGPRSKAVLQTILGGDGLRLPGPTRNTLITVQMLGAQVPIARTGYTGEPVGFELLPPAEIASALWSNLLEAGGQEGIVPCGLGARDTLRMEANLPLYGHELGRDAEQREMPIYSGRLARTCVSFARTKGHFIGKEALLEHFEEVKLRLQGLLHKSQKEHLVPRMIMPVALLAEGIARAGYEVYTGETMVGYVTSGTMIPFWGMEGTGVLSRPGAQSGRRAICLAYLDANLTEGQELLVSIRDKQVPAQIVSRHLAGEAAPYARPVLVNEQHQAAASHSGETLEALARRLVLKARDNTLWRQRATINLIPSETTVSPLVKLLSIADPAGRYAEHRRVKALDNVEAYYYQGTQFIAGVEVELAEQMKQFLDCPQVETRVISGQMANAAVFSGLLEYLNRVDRVAEPRRFRSVMNHHIGMGGHLSSQPMGALRDYIALSPITERPAVVNFPWSQDNPWRIDLNRTAELVAEHKPELVILGRSAVLCKEPVSELARMLSTLKPRPLLMYDTAHVFGLLGPHFQQPFAEGADIITASTHKTFFGTQRGIIASNLGHGIEAQELWESIVRRVFPGSVSNHHLGTLLGLLMATYEMNAFKDAYQRQVIANARAFARALKQCGFRVEGDPTIDYTETHQVILRFDYARGTEVAHRLEVNNIIVNYQALPGDESFTAASGIRMGVQEMTRFGMTELDFQELAGYMADILLRGKAIPETISKFRGKFVRMHYCLSEEQARPLLEALRWFYM
ncbi:MAG: glycine cleavage system aminomethyltransferase GcvT [Chloroflexi bacterium]|nr:glycine cleavage system aminomethyltransferase GcvT [Chloroflexota bacterium]